MSHTHLRDLKRTTNLFPSSLAFGSLIILFLKLSPHQPLFSAQEIKSGRIFLQARPELWPIPCMIQKLADGLWDLGSSALVFFVARQVFLKSCKVMFLLHSNLSLHKIQIIDFQGPAKCGPCLHSQLYPSCLPSERGLPPLYPMFISFLPSAGTSAHLSFLC